MSSIVYLEENDIDTERHMYEFIETDGKIAMKFYENDTSWTALVRGKNAGVLKESNSGELTIKLPLSNKKIVLDSLAALELLMLLKFFNEDSEMKSGRHSFTKMKTMKTLKEIP